MRRARSVVGLALLAACHSGAIMVERRSSGAIDEDLYFEPKLGRDGHYISLPGHPLVNCVDPLWFDADAKDWQRAAPSSKLRTACAESSLLASFVGYRRGDMPSGSHVSWVNPVSDQQWDEAREKLRKTLNVPSLDDPHAQFSFLHFSDIQIREPEAKLTNAEASRELDALIPTFERNYDQEIFSKYVYSAIVDTANAELRLHRPAASADASTPARLPPQFMIHTGDAVDAGLASEFEDFLSISNKLEIPWYQALGNHDVLAFGNLRMLKPRSAVTERKLVAKGYDQGGDESCGPANPPGTCTCTQVADLIRHDLLDRPDNRGRVSTEPSERRPSVAPIMMRRICMKHAVDNDRFVMDPAGTASASNAFIHAHCFRSKGRCIPHSAPDVGRIAYPVPPRDAENECADFGDPNRGSLLHGMDLGPGAARLRDRTNIAGSSASISGYYCFRVRADGLEAKQRKVWAIVLDTTTTSGAYGDISNEQLRWLDRILSSRGPHDLVMVFGHHPLWNFYRLEARDVLTQLLTSHRGVIGYFGGHTHSPQLRVVHPGGEREHSKACAGGHHFWEIIAPSVIGFPQQVRQVTMKTMGDQIGYFEIVTFAPTSDSNGSKVARATAGAKKDYCAGHRDCTDGEPRLMSRAATYSRLFFRMPE